MHEATFVVGMGRKRPDAEGLFHFMDGRSLLKSKAVKMLDACYYYAAKPVKRGTSPLSMNVLEQVFPA